MFKKATSLTCTIVLLSGCTVRQHPIPHDQFLGEVEATYNLAEQWFLSNMQDNGLFRYLYNVKTGEYQNKNNAIRQLMASRLLAELSAEDPLWISLHNKNLGFIFTNWYREEGDRGYIYFNGKSKLGANAMALRTLSASPFFDEYADQAHKLANSVLSLMNEEGAFHPWLKEPSYEYDADYLLTFYSGEAILALLEYYERRGDRRILEAAEHAQEFYRDRYVVHLEENYYPAYVPWHTISLSKFYRITGDQKYADAVFLLNDKLLELLDEENFVGRFYNPQTPQYGSPHSSSDGVYTEGLAYAYEVAREVGDTEREARYGGALKLAVHHLAQLQYKGDERRGRRYPERFIGAIRYKEGDERIRIDTVQHAMDALRKIKSIIQ